MYHTLSLVVFCVVSILPPSVVHRGRMVKWQLDKSLFSLNHPNADLFHRSQWDPPGVTSLWYVIYRITVALLMVAGVVADIVNDSTTLGAKWIIYMTSQGILLLTVHYVIYAIIVVQRRLAPASPVRLHTSDFDIVTSACVFIYRSVLVCP